MKSYGIESQDTQTGAAVPSIHDVELARDGFTIFPDLLSSEELEQYRAAVDAVLVAQEKEFGTDRLAAISEQDMARSVLRYDARFMKMAAHPVIVRFAQQEIGGRKMILNSQNGIINRPTRRHYQSAWHRDLPYQTFVASRPLAISVLFALDPFTPETGGTQVLPGSHLHEQYPDQAYVERHIVTPSVPAGAALAFNSMLFHRGGENRSQIIRRGINHVYSIPLMAPQVALHDLDCGGDPTLHMLFGKDFIVPESALAWRERKWSALALRQQNQSS